MHNPTNYYKNNINKTQNTENYTLSLHDALPIYLSNSARMRRRTSGRAMSASLPCGSDCPWLSKRLRTCAKLGTMRADRKSTRLNSSHVEISYAVFCLKKKS